MAVLSAAAAAPPARTGFPYCTFVRPVARQEVVDPADADGVAWLCDLLRRGRADLYALDEADLCLLPSLTSTWMKRGQQRKVRAPGTNQKRSVAAAVDIGDGEIQWRTDERRCAVQFGLLGTQCIVRSRRRRRLAILLVDNAKSHQLGKTGIVRRFLDAWRGSVVLVYLPAYSPDLMPAEQIWRQWRPNVTHNHTRSEMEPLVGDSDRWFERQNCTPSNVLRMLVIPCARSKLQQAA